MRSVWEVDLSKTRPHHNFGTMKKGDWSQYGIISQRYAITIIINTNCNLYYFLPEASVIPQEPKIMLGAIEICIIIIM